MYKFVCLCVYLFINISLLVRSFVGLFIHSFMQFIKSRAHLIAYLTGSINRVPTCPVGVKVTSVGWQITLCDPIDKWRPVVLK